MTTTSQRTTSILPLRYWYASLLRDHTKEEKRKQRMTLALANIRVSLMQESAENGLPVLLTDDPSHEGKQAINGLERATQGVAVIVELWSLNPFHPHVIRYSDAEAKAAMATIVKQAAVPVEVEILENFWDAAERAFGPSNRTQVLKRVTGGLILAALVAGAVVTSGASAPTITAALAMLGGGAIASGGFGMAGGMTALWIGGLAGGGLLNHTAQILLHIGSEGLRMELIKLDVTQRLWWREGTPGVPSRTTVIKQQNGLLEKLNELLAQEQLISDPNSAPNKELAEMVRLCKVSVARFEALG